MYFRAVVIIVLLAITVPVHAAGPHGTQPGQPLTDLGYVALNDQVAQTLADTGAGFVRVNFRLGPYQADTPEWYAIYDGIVNRLRSRGLEVIALMTNEAWPGGQPLWIANAYETTGGNGWNPYLQNWCNFFLRAATHWQGKIKYWELWNEPDCLAVIHPSNYGALLANAYDLARTNNLPVEIISGGVCGGYTPYGPAYISETYRVSITNTGWFTQMKEKWGTYPLDHIGFHVYPNCSGTLNTSWLSNYLDDVYSSYRVYEGVNTTKKLFLTEIGWQANSLLPDITVCKVSESRQASNLTSMFNIVNSKPYVKCVTWFFLKDEPAADLYFGVFRHTGLGESDKKPSWANLKIMCTYEGRESAGGAVNQPILDYYNLQGHVKMGNPYDNGGSAWVHKWDFGPVQDYDGGEFGRMVVFDTADGAGRAARGNFWRVALDHHNTLEFPLTDQTFTGAGEVQYFECGYATWNASEGARVTLYPVKEVTDNSGPGFSASANWTLKSATDAWGGSYRSRTGTTGDTDPATWTIALPQPGHYDVYARWPTVSGASSSAQYQVTHSAGTTAVTTDQQVRGGRWNRLGTYHFAAGNATLRLSSQGSSSLSILADAVRLVGPVPGYDETPPSVPVVTDDGEFTSSATQLRASWSSSDLESGIQRFEYAIGATPQDPGEGYLVAWTDVGVATSVTRQVTLKHNTTYYFYVRAVNGAGLFSMGVSDGIRVDISPPARPTITDDGDYTGDPTMLHCSWSSFDPESGVARFEYSVGTIPYVADVVPVTDAGPATEAWITGLSLSPGVTYYINARAINGAGIPSSYGYANGIRCESAFQAPTIGEALAIPDSAIVLLSGKMISANYWDRFYLTEPGGIGGIAVQPRSICIEGALVDVTGTMQSLAGERVLVTGAVTPVQR